MKPAALFVAFFAALTLTVTTVNAEPDPATVTVPAQEYALLARQAAERDTYARRWAQERRNAVARAKTIRRLRRELRRQWRPSSLLALQYAAVAYGQSATTLTRKASCETGGTFSPFAYNRTSRASGLMQFLPSTWRTTPYARFSIFDPYANALAGAWMHRVGRGREWACR